MIVLNAPNDLLKITTGSAGTVHVYAAYSDNMISAPVLGRVVAPPIVTATTITLLAAPADTGQRAVALLAVSNTDATIANVVTIAVTDGTNTLTLWTGSLVAGAAIIYNPSTGFQMRASGGMPKLAA